MSLGAITSVGASVTHAIDGYSLKILLAVPILSFSYLSMLFTAFMLGVMGALGGLVVREAYKLVINKFFPGLKPNKNENTEE